MKNKTCKQSKKTCGGTKSNKKTCKQSKKVRGGTITSDERTAKRKAAAAKGQATKKRNAEEKMKKKEAAAKERALQKANEKEKIRREEERNNSSIDEDNSYNNSGEVQEWSSEQI